MATKKAPPPKGLSTAGKALWQPIAAQWADLGLIPDARELRLLADACREADMLSILEGELDAAVSAGQLIVKGSQGQPVTTSLVAECRRSRAQVAALLGKLGFTDAAEPRVGSGGRQTSAGARAAALTRWHGNGSGMGA